MKVNFVLIFVFCVLVTRSKALQENCDADECVNPETTTNIPFHQQCGQFYLDPSRRENLISDEYPWTALIQYTYPNGEKGFHCEGVLISHQHVLTSSNCVNGKAITEAGYKLTGVRLGDWQLSTETDCDDSTYPAACSEPHRDFGVEQTFPHENYDPQSTNQHNDIALLKLSERIDRFTLYIKPICLPIKKMGGNNNLTGSKMSVVGWGLTINSIGSDIKCLHHANKISHEDCQSKFTSIYKSLRRNITSSQICATHENDQKPCISQSGESLMSLESSQEEAPWNVVGVRSYGPGPSPNGNLDWPEVYTRVDQYIDWIVSKMKP